MVLFKMFIEKMHGKCTSEKASGCACCGFALRLLFSMNVRNLKMFTLIFKERLFVVLAPNYQVSELHPSG